MQAITLLPVIFTPQLLLARLKSAKTKGAVFAQEGKRSDQKQKITLDVKGARKLEARILKGVR